MIDVEYFDEPAEASLVLEQIGTLVQAITGRPTRMKLLRELDSPTERRIIGLRDDAFGGGPEVFDRRALAEVAADPDSLFAVLEIDGSIEACCFGYYEEPGSETVPGTDFYLDTAACASRWQDHGIAHIAGAGVLLLVHLLPDVRRAGISIWDGGRADDLVRFYRQFGFVSAQARTGPYPAMAVEVDDEQVRRWRTALGIPAQASRG